MGVAATDFKFLGKSLSARRAWIEIFDVAHLPEPSTRRSPQGERG